MKKGLPALILIAQFAMAIAFGQTHPNDLSAAAETAYETQAFKPATPGSIKVFANMQSGNPERDNIECGELTWDGKKWHLNLRIGIMGASSYTYQPGIENLISEATQWQKNYGDPHTVDLKYFKNGKAISNLEQIPEVASMIKTQMQGIAKSLSTEFVETTLDFFFLDENKFTAMEVWNPVRQTKAYGKTFLPFNYMAIPTMTVITPGSGDPYAWPEPMAHELFHLISREHKNDGFDFGNYPLKGVMNNPSTFDRLRKHSLTSKLLALEFNTLVSNQLAFRDKMDIYEMAKRPEFFPNFYTETGALTRQYSKAPLQMYYDLQKAEKDPNVKKMSEYEYAKFYLDRKEKAFFSRPQSCHSAVVRK